MIPSEAIAGFDIRVSPNMPFEVINKLLEEWCSENGVTWKHVMFKETKEHYITKTDNNQYYMKMTEII